MPDAMSRSERSTNGLNAAVGCSGLTLLAAPAEGDGAGHRMPGAPLKLCLSGAVPGRQFRRNRYNKSRERDARPPSLPGLSFPDNPRAHVSHMESMTSPEGLRHQQGIVRSFVFWEIDVSAVL